MKNNIWKRFLIGFLGSTLLAGIIFFVYQKYGIETNYIPSNIEIIGFVIIYISLILGYVFYTMDDEKYKFGLQLLIYINFFFFGYIFFTKILGFENMETIKLLGNMLIILLLFFGKNKNLNILIFLFSLIFIVQMVIYILPNYKNPPDIKGFIAIKNNQIILPNNKQKNAKISVINGTNLKEFLLNSNNKNFTINIKNGTKIIYSNYYKEKDKTAKIMLTNGSVIELYPQSLIKFDIVENNEIKKYELQLEQGSINIYSNLFSFENDLLMSKLDKKIYIVKNGQFTKSSSSGVYKIDGHYKIYSGNKTFWMENEKINIYSNRNNKLQIELLMEKYNNDLQERLIKQLGSKIYKYKTIDWLMQKFINLENSIYPNKNWDKIQNYQEFKKYLEYKTNENIEKKDFNLKQSGIKSMFNLGIDRTSLFNK